MPSYEDRKAIVTETLLKRLGRMYRADERTSAVIEEACRAVVQRLPSDYDTAACEAVCEEAGTRVVGSHRYATWPSVAEVAGAVADVVSERMKRERADERDRRIDAEAAQPVSKRDQWTLEGARERVRRCDEMIRQYPGNPVWVHLRGIAVAAEGKCAERGGAWDGRKGD